MSASNLLTANDSAPSRICYDNIVQASVLRYAAALRHIYIVATEKDNYKGNAVTKRSNEPSFNPAEAIASPNIKHVPLLVSSPSLNSLLTSRVLEGLYKLCSVLPV